MGKVYAKQKRLSKMLFTKSSSNGIQIEDHILLVPQAFHNVGIKANQQRIKKFVEGLGYKVQFLPKDSDFAIVIGKALFAIVIGKALPKKIEVKALALEHAKLVSIAREVMNLALRLPSEEKEAEEELHKITTFEKMCDDFETAVKAVFGETIGVEINLVVCSKEES